MTKEEAIRIVRNNWPENRHQLSEALQTLIPELKESEDERIRKEILYVINQLDDNTTICGRNYDFQKWISWLEKQGEQPNPYSGVSFEYDGHIWGMCARDNGVDILLDKQLFEHLEKQGEQKSTDIAEPKFKNGQWIVWQDKCYKVNYNGCGYELVNQNGLSTSLEYGTIDENAHLWDIIQDAKEGDVLCYEDEVFILKNYVLFHKIVYHCCYDGKNLVSHSIYSLTKDDFNKIHPATEEQRDLLFSKMKEAGYEWDTEKKELKKIEQNPAWGEEDEIILDSIIEDVMPCGEIPDYPTDEEREYFHECNRKVDWLKSIKKRMKGE